MKSCPGCGAVVAWPVGSPSVTCPGCGKLLMLEQGVQAPSKVGQQVMIVGLVIVALAVVIAVVTAL